MPRKSQSNPHHGSVDTITEELLQKLLLDAAWVQNPAGLDGSAVVQQLIQQFAPQDAAERLLVQQMIATHTRVLHLSRHANNQKNARWFSLFQAELTKTMHLYRGQMQTLAAYRRPRRQTFTAIRTANIAAQQVVQSRRKLKRAHPLAPLPGVAHALPTPNCETPTPPQADVPPFSDRPSISDRRDPEEPALDPQHRPPHHHRQNNVEPQ